MFDYLEIRKKIRSLKMKGFDDLEVILDENEKLKKDKLQMRNNYETRISEIERKYSDDLYKIKLSVDAEKKEMLTTHKMDIKSLKHDIELQREKFETEKQNILLKVERELSEKRKEFLEKNHGDIDTVLDRNVRQTESLLNAFGNIFGNKQNIGIELKNKDAK